MTLTFDRTDHSVFGRWWWTVDRWLLAAVLLLVAVGCILIMAASPAVAERIGLSSSTHFVERHLVILLPSLLLMVVMSILPVRTLRQLALVGFVGALVLVALTFVVGVEIKGARRWIHVPGLSLQPSEFIKPAFAVVTAWLFAQWRNGVRFTPCLAAMGLYALVAGLLIRQPDLGQTFVVTAVWFSQFFLAGLNLFLVIILGALAVGGLVGAYFFLPHVASRIDRFLDPAAGDNYQVQRSLEAFANGGLLGTGPGQGSVKMYLPDAHADFIFAVAGEEFGLIACLIIVALFVFILTRGFQRVFADGNLFVVLAVSGLLIQFALQALINMGSALHLMPTKGMTLPFVSYGGSSLLALGYGMGMVLALTRRSYGSEDGT